MKQRHYPLLSQRLCLADCIIQAGVKKVQNG